MDHTMHSEEPVQSEQPVDHTAHQQLLERKDYTRITHEYSVPRVTLSNQNGEKMFLPDLLEADEPVLLNFIYTTCVTICPVLTASFSDVQKALGPEADNVKMVSISIDPEYDTPQKLRDYSARYQAADGWQFLTGDLADIVLILKSFDAYRRDKMNHIPLTFLRGTPNGAWTRLEGFPSVHELMEEFEAVTAGAAHQH